ncbi:hypothetical protein FHS96_002510 [Sphingomonas zeicaulis]|uniref:hypothetical protein n=1 Tax=Sphingomonas zeicaulis TaxID=1632740 RepID=UPI003D20F13C
MRSEDSNTPWWERRTTMVLLTLIAFVPLLWPDIPPMVDLPGHMGRYRVQLDLATSPFLRQWYSFDWAVIGNLGVDLLIEPLHWLGLGLEPSVKLIVMTIPPLTVAGFLWVAREVHGRVPPTTMFALPLAFNFPFIFGFVNFALSMALAFVAFGLWLRMGRTGHVTLRAAIFVPISCAIWVTHAFGWGTLGVLVFSVELVRAMDRGNTFFRAGIIAGLHCLPLTPPMVLMLVWRGQDPSAQTGDWFDWQAKLSWFAMVLRDRWRIVDMLSLAVLIIVMLEALRDKRLTFSRNLAISTLFLLAVFIILPRIVFGSAYADMRLAPFMVATALLAIRPRPETDLKFRHSVALVAALFMVLRLGANTASFWLFDRAYDRELAALDHVPRGARMMSYVGKDCVTPWMMHRLEHMPGLAIVRREAFSNDQWVAAGAQLVRTHFPTGWRYSRDPSQIVTGPRCRGEVWWPLNRSLAHLPRERFDYVWLIAPRRHDPRLMEGMTEIWRQGSSSLWRIDSRAAPAAAADYPIPPRIIRVR